MPNSVHLNALHGELFTGNNLLFVGRNSVQQQVGGKSGSTSKKFHEISYGISYSEKKMLSSENISQRTLVGRRKNASFSQLLF